MTRQGQLIRRGPQTWLVRIYAGRDGTGRRRYVNQTVHGPKKDAEKVVVALLRARDTSALAEPTRQTVSEWVDEWLQLVRPTIGPRTYADYVTVVNRRVRPALGAIRLAKLTTADVQRFVTRLMDEGLKPNTIRLTVAPLRAALRTAVRLGKLIRTPAEHVTVPRLERTERCVLAPAEASRLLAACEEDDLWGPLVVTLLMTGLRPGELCALRWADLDGNVLRVQRALAHGGEGWVVREPKTARSRRAIVLSEIELRALARQRRNQAEQRLRAGAAWQDHGLIFASAVGTPYDPGNIARRGLPRLLRRAELPSMRLYDLRHSCATLLLAGGVNPKIVSERLGHSTVAMTLNTYCHVLPAMQQEAADTLARLVTAGRGPVAS